MFFIRIKNNHKFVILNHLKTYKNEDIINLFQNIIFFSKNNDDNFYAIISKNKIDAIIGISNYEVYYLSKNNSVFFFLNNLKLFLNQSEIIKTILKVEQIKIKINQKNIDIIELCNNDSKYKFLYKYTKTNLVFNTYILFYREYISQLKELEKTENKNQYLVKSDCISQEKINKLFNNKDWSQYNIKTKKKLQTTKYSTKKKSKLDYLHVDASAIKNKSYYIKSHLKNLIDTSIILEYTIKNKIFDNLFKLNNTKLNKFLPNQTNINLYSIFKNKLKIIDFKNLFKKSKIFIFKYSYSAGGKNIAIFTEFNQLQEFIEEIIKHNSYKWEKLDYKEYLRYSYNKKSLFNIEWVLQEYITDPLLYKNKKFHLRTYFLFNNINKKYYYFDKSIIATARLNYKNQDYLNKDIHDTHFYRTDRQITFPDDFNKILNNKEINNINKQIEYLFKHIGELIKTRVKCYLENKLCYHLFGADLLIDNDLQVKLLELNTNPGCTSNIFRKGKYNYPESIFENIIRDIVNPVFKIKNKTRTNNDIKFIELSS